MVYKYFWTLEELENCITHARLNYSRRLPAKTRRSLAKVLYSLVDVLVSTKLVLVKDKTSDLRRDAVLEQFAFGVRRIVGGLTLIQSRYFVEANPILRGCLESLLRALAVASDGTSWRHYDMCRRAFLDLEEPAPEEKRWFDFYRLLDIVSESWPLNPDDVEVLKTGWKVLSGLSHSTIESLEIAKGTSLGTVIAAGWTINNQVEVVCESTCICIDHGKTLLNFLKDYKDRLVETMSQF